MKGHSKVELKILKKGNTKQNKKNYGKADYQESPTETPH